MPAKSLALKHTIKLIREMDAEIEEEEIENEIRAIMDEIYSPILTIPGISYRMGAMIISEIDDFNRFDSPDKILAYAGMSPSTYQSGFHIRDIKLNSYPQHLYLCFCIISIAAVDSPLPSYVVSSLPGKFFSYHFSFFSQCALYPGKSRRPTCSQ